ncbi:hypothetical protein F0562_030523 [Nyssa sinensis]|uniref:Uncharacterized protein n=1 Tax=Nyssa sinensis TaxID=561372 RepID=A0A5J5AZ09_9ASTE|nr:hypothetical protein F0562_030523 [Nyssa sinensis]
MKQGGQSRQGNHRQSLRLSLKNILGRNGILTSWTAEPATRQCKEDLGRALFLYVGSHPSQLEPAWEDMKLCKTVAVMMRGGLFGLDEAIRNGILTSWTAEPATRQCKEDLGRALFLYVGSHPSQLEPAWEDMKLCKTVAVMMRGGLFGLDEAIRCCHDCLYALLTATAARI